MIVKDDHAAKQQNEMMSDADAVIASTNVFELSFIEKKQKKRLKMTAMMTQMMFDADVVIVSMNVFELSLIEKKQKKKLKMIAMMTQMMFDVDVVIASMNVFELSFIEKKQKKKLKMIAMMIKSMTDFSDNNFFSIQITAQKSQTNVTFHDVSLIFDDHQSQNIVEKTNSDVSFIQIKKIVQKCISDIVDLKFRF